MGCVLCLVWRGCFCQCVLPFRTSWVGASLVVLPFLGPLVWALFLVVLRALLCRWREPSRPFVSLGPWCSGPGWVPVGVCGCLAVGFLLSPSGFFLICTTLVNQQISWPRFSRSLGKSSSRRATSWRVPCQSPPLKPVPHPRTLQRSRAPSTCSTSVAGS